MNAYAFCLSHVEVVEPSKFAGQFAGRKLTAAEIETAMETT